MASMPKEAKRALNAMKDLGFPLPTVIPILKNLLRLYENNWAHIEAENYKLLVDTILDSQESKDSGNDRNKEVIANDELESYREHEEEHPSTLFQSSKIHGETSLKRMRLERDDSLATNSGQERIKPLSPRVRPGVIPSLQEKRADVVEPQPSSRDEKPQPLSFQPSHRELGASRPVHKTHSTQGMAGSSSLVTPQRDGRGKCVVNDRTENMICFKEPQVEPGIENLQNYDNSKNLSGFAWPNNGLCRSEYPEFEVPIVMKTPSNKKPARNHVHRNQPNHKSSSMGNGDFGHMNTSKRIAELHADRRDEKERFSNAAYMSGTTNEPTNIREPPSATTEIASSTLGEVKLSFTCSLLDFHMPSLEDLFKVVEDKCLRSYKLVDPNFSLMNLMKEICQCALELGSRSTVQKQENIIKIIPSLESLKKSGYRDIFRGMPACTSNGSPNMATSAYLNNETQRSNGVKESRDLQPSGINSHNLAVVQRQQVAIGNIKPIQEINDISKGEERVRIPVVNEVGGKQYPQSFYYIPHNIVYQNGYVNFSLARIGDESCCSDCSGDCLAASIPCACARETGGVFAYTLDGLLKKDFLDACISANHDPQKHRLYYCQDCPLERSKNEVKPDPCRGHLIRRFVKECWSKCGCNKQCGNRIVQRGITCNLQVFFSGQGKGWGVRTLHEIPRGAFVCEYVGEILTNMELYDRTIKTTGNAKHTYPVLLDADWGSEGVLKDEEALCLDATFYGNVGRFINHRCYDANLIEIPVEVETPDHHYYHLAFFTTRRIEASEELTWDYGIDFDDHSHPVKAFRCRCGSKFCRDKNRVTKTRSNRPVLG